MTNKQKQQRLAEYRTIAKIGQRAVKLLGNSHDYTTIIMDIECVHKKMPLGLARLLAADNFNFISFVGFCSASVAGYL